MPYITEEIWQTIKPLVGNTYDSIMLQGFPVADESQIDNESIEDLEWVKTFIIGIRKIRSEMDIHPASLSLFFFKTGQIQIIPLEKNSIFINSLAKIESAEWLERQKHLISYCTVW